MCFAAILRLEITFCGFRKSFRLKNCSHSFSIAIFPKILKSLELALITLQAESTQVMDELQKQETRNKKNKDVYDKLKGDLRMIKEQLQAMQRALEPKVPSVFVCF